MSQWEVSENANAAGWPSRVSIGADGRDFHSHDYLEIIYTHRHNGAPGRIRTCDQGVAVPCLSHLATGA